MPETPSREPYPSSPDLSRLRHVGLHEVLDAAAANVRVDRKYVVPAGAAQQLVDALRDDVHVLQIDNRRWTSYRSTYFDTHDLLTCRAHVQQRRRRWKARSRLYVEDGFCRLEVKVRDGSGRTTKRYHPVDRCDYGRLTASGGAFLHDELGRWGFDEVGEVTPSLEVTYRRATLADLASGMRVTLDAAVRATRADKVVRLGSDRLIVETKGGLRPAAADRVLLDLGLRPRSFSKYAAGITLTDDRVADNDVRRMLGHELHLDLAGAL